MEKILIKTPTIRLEQFLKLSGMVYSGGEAKTLIQEGMIKVNNHVEQRRGKSLQPGDVITMPDGIMLKVVFQEDELCT